MGTTSRKRTSEEPSHAFVQAIADEHLSFLLCYLARLGVPSQDIEDVAQEVLAGAYRAYPRFDPARGSVRSWLIGIATNQASNHRRRAHRRRERLWTDDDLADLPDGTPDSEQHAIDGNGRDLLDELLWEIPIERRGVFIAHEILELEMSEVAEALSIPLSTAWSRHRMAWDDLQAARRRWYARQRGSKLAVFPFGLAALVSGAREDREVPLGQLARLRDRLRSAVRPSVFKGLVSGAGAIGAQPLLTGLLGAAAGAALAGAVAFALLRAASERAVRGEAAAPPPMASSSAALAAPAQTTGATALAAPAQTAAPAAPAQIAALTGPAQTAAPVAPAPVTPARTAGTTALAAPLRPVRETASRSAVASPTPAAPPSEDPEIAAERSLLLHALAALEAGQYADAKRNLEKHLRDFPRGRLTAERDAALRALKARVAR